MNVFDDEVRRELKKAFVFENLSDLERLEIVAFDPAFQMVCKLLPQYGERTKPSVTSTTGMMLVGVFTVICGSDDRANAELRRHWLQVREMFIATGIPAPAQALTVDNWRDFRDTFLTGRTRGGEKNKRSDDDRLGEIVAQLRVLVREAAIGQARTMGLLDSCVWQPGADGLWADIPMERTILGDGFWVRELYSVNPTPRPSRSGKKGKSVDKRQVRLTRSKVGERRTSRQIDTRGNATGYENVIVSVRGPQPRRWIVLDVVRAPGGEEMAPFIESMGLLREALADREFLALYDGAMRGVHHRKLRTTLGIMTVNKAHGFDGNAWEKQRGRRVRASARTIPLTLTASNGETCVKQVLPLASLLWVVEEVGGVPRTVRVADHHLATRTEADDGYEWQLKMSVYCPHHDEHHFFTLDPNEVYGKRELAEQLRILPQSLAKEFGRVYGRRNAAESGMRHLRYLMGEQKRSGSVTADRTDLDVLLAVMLNNALAWAEHTTKERYGIAYRYNGPRRPGTAG